LPKKEPFYKQKNTTPQLEDARRLAPDAIVFQQMTADTTTNVLKAEPADEVVVIGYGKAKRNITGNEILSGKVAGIEEATQKEFKGKVLDAMGEPMAFASVRAKNEKVATVADSKGNFTILARDSVLNIDVSSPGYVTANTKLKVDSTANTVVLKEAQSSLAEIVMTDIAKRRKSDESKKDQSARELNAAPVGGWKRFEQYIVSKVDSLKETADYKLDGEEIVLEFSIDKNGLPVDIKAPEKVNKTAAKHAISILANGPKWKAIQSEKRVKVTIAF
jgi:hypothetical protein